MGNQVIRKVFITLIGVSLLAGAALAADPQQPFMPFYWVKGRVTSAETGDPVTDRTVAFYKDNYSAEPRVTATTDAAGYYKVNTYELNYYYGTPITYETESYKVAVPRTPMSNRGTEESITLSVGAGYIVNDLVLIEGGGPTERPLGAGPIINMVILLEGLNRGTPDNNISSSLEVEIRSGGATADTALPANMVATCEVSLTSNGSGSNYGWWYNDVFPTAGQKYYLVIKQKILGAPLGANHIPIITASSWEVVNQPGSLTLDLSSTADQAYTPTGRVSAMNRKSLGGTDKWLMRAGYFAVGSRITVSDYNRWRDAYVEGIITDPARRALEQKITNAKGEGDLSVSDYNAWRDTYINLEPNRARTVPWDDVYVP